MGNIFSGEVEDLLLGSIGALLLAIVLGLAALEVVLRRRLRAHAESWLAPPAPVDERSAHYRAPAAVQLAPRAPRSVRWLARALAAWGLGIAAFWVFAAACTFALAGLSPLMFVPAVLGVLPPWRLTQAGLALCDRHDATLAARTEQARWWLLAHHVVVLLVGTGFLVLLVLSNQYFWTGLDDQRASQLAQFLVSYALGVLLPTLGAIGLARWLRSVRGLYAVPAA